MYKVIEIDSFGNEVERYHCQKEGDAMQWKEQIEKRGGNCKIVII